MEAMARLPGLEQVIVNFKYGIMDQMAALRESFPATDEGSRAREENIPQGAMQLRSILLSAHNADTRLKVLRCGGIDLKSCFLQWSIRTVNTFDTPVVLTTRGGKID